MDIINLSDAIIASPIGIKTSIFIETKWSNNSSEDEREDISSRDAVAYEDQILAAIAKENWHFENDRGLAEYIHDEALKEKMHSLYPTVELKNINIDEITEKVCVNENVTSGEITKKIRIQKISDIRKAIVLPSEEYCNVSN